MRLRNGLEKEAVLIALTCGRSEATLFSADHLWQAMLLNFLPRTPPFVAQVLVGPRTDGKILGGEISTCLMESSQQDWNAAEKQEQLNNETYIDPLHQCFWKVI